MKMGRLVEFVDEHGKSHEALVTAIFDNGDSEKYPTPSINVVFVSDDLTKHDQYGQQIERRTSVPHNSNQSAHGYCWK